MSVYIYIYIIIYIYNCKKTSTLFQIQTKYILHLLFCFRIKFFYSFYIDDALFAALHLHFVHPGIYPSTFPALHFCFQDLGFFDQWLQNNGLF